MRSIDQCDQFDYLAEIYPYPRFRFRDWQNWDNALHLLVLQQKINTKINP